MRGSRRFWLGLAVSLLAAVPVLPPGLPARAQTAQPQVTLAIRWVGPGTRVGTPLQLTLVEIHGNRDVPAADPPAWSAPGATVTAQGVFTAPAPGEYRVTATTPGGSAVATVPVWGPPDRLLLSGPNTVAGDGQSVAWITARVLDSRGAPVADFSGHIRLLAPAGGRIGGAEPPGTEDVSDRTEKAEAGAARFSLVVPSGLVGQELRVIGWADADGNGQYDILTDVAARYGARVVPRLDLSLRLRPVSPTLSTDGAPVTLTAELVDAGGSLVTGQPVNAQVLVFGPGRLSAGQVNLAPGQATVRVSVTGPGARVFVRLTAPGFAPAELALPVAAPGPATALEMSLDGTAAVPVGNDPGDGIVLHLGLVDAAGTPVPAAGHRIRLLVPHAAASHLTVDGRPLPAGAPNAAGMAEVPVTLTGAATTPIRLQSVRYTGELKLELHPGAAEPDGTALTPAEATVRFLPGDPAQLSLVGTALEIPNARPGFTVRAEVQDRFGNLVPVTGLRVQMSYQADPATVLQFATDGSRFDLETVDGRAEAGTGVHGRSGTNVTFQVDQAAWQWLPLRPIQGGAGLSMTIQPALSRSLMVRLVTGEQQVTSVKAGDQVRILVIAKDSKGQVASDWATMAALTVKTPSSSPYDLSGLTWSFDAKLGGYVTAPFIVGQAGSWPVTVTHDPLNRTRLVSSGSTTLRVLPGPAESVRLFDDAGYSPRFRAGAGAWAFKAKPVDAWGNPAVFPAATTVAVAVSGPPGGDLAVRQYAGGPAVSSLTLTGATTVYLSATVPGTYRVSFEAPGRRPGVTYVSVLK